MGGAAGCTDEEELEMELGAEVDSTPMLCTVATARESKKRKAQTSLVFVFDANCLCYLYWPEAPESQTLTPLQIPVSVDGEAKGIAWNG
eukprot:3338263-Amphidinium_carterae.3